MKRDFKNRLSFVLFGLLLLIVSSVVIGYRMKTEDRFYPLSLSGAPDSRVDVAVQLSTDLYLRDESRLPSKLVGMHGRESFGQWTSSLAAELHGIGPINIGNEVEVCALAFPPSKGVKGIVRVGNEDFGAQFSDELICLRFVYSGHRQANMIGFYDYPVASPRDIGISEDTRPLGIAIFSITIFGSE